MPLKLEIRKDNNPEKHWYVTGSQFGERIRRSTGTPDRAQAEIIFAKIQKDLFERHTFGPQATCTFVEAAVSFFAAGKGGKDLRFFERLLYVDIEKKIPTEFALKKLRDIDQLCLDALVAQYYPDGARPGTLVRSLYSPVRAVMTHAAKRKLCALPMFDCPQPGEGRTRWLKPEEAERLVAGCSPHFAPYVTFLLGTGCRKTEGLYLDWREVDLEAGHVTIIGTTEDDDDDIQTKNGRQRIVPLTPRVLAALRALPHREGAVFRTDTGEPYTRPDERGRGGANIYSAFATAMKHAGLKRVHPHLTRHTFATWHVMYGTHQFELMRLGGWSDVDMVKRYSHMEGIKLTPPQRAAIAAWIDPDATIEPPAKLRVVA